MRTQIVLGITLFAAAALGSPYGYGSGGAGRSARPRIPSVKCPIVFDGRVPLDTEPTDLDVANEIFEHEFVKGAGLNFSQIVNFPEIPGSRFDSPDLPNSKFAVGLVSKPFQVTITDDSIFNNQTGFRRAEMLFKGNSGKAPDPSIEGVMIVHWSVMQDSEKPLDLSHEYLTVFREAADFSGNQFNFLAGTLIAGVPEGASGNFPSTWKVLDRNNTQIFSTPILLDVWQNFAVKMDMVENTLQVFASENDEPLVPVTNPVANDNSGGGQFHCGVLKKPTGNVQDITKEGVQEAGILEGLTYTGLFVENGDDGCISL